MKTYYWYEKQLTVTRNNERSDPGIKLEARSSKLEAGNLKLIFES